MGVQKALFIFFFLSLFSLFPFGVSAAEVVINEALFDPSGADTGQEWVELYNSGSEEADISGWQVYPDGVGYFSFPQGMKIGAGKFIVVHLRSAGIQTFSDVYHVSASSNMGNTSGSIALFSAEPRGKDTIKDFVQWGKGGETWESAAVDAGLWEKGAYIDLGSFSEGKSLSLDRDGIRGGKSGWLLSASPTQGALNNGAGSASSSSPPATLSSSTPASPASVSSASASLPGPPPPLSLRVEAGEDRKEAVGSEVEFFGTALGLKGEPLENARYWWNFGDGEFKEGRRAWHIFRIPGMYTVGLHVSSGELSGADYVKAEIGANRIAVAEVLPGSEGYIKIANTDKNSIDIGNWTVEDAEGIRFAVPLKTRIAGGAEIAFSNTVTGLLKSGKKEILIFRYPNGEKAFTEEPSAKKMENAPFPEENASNEAERMFLASSSTVASRVPDTVSGSEDKADKAGDAAESVLKSSERAAVLASLAPGGGGENEERKEKDGLIEKKTKNGVSPRLLLGGAVGLSVLAAVGFFFLRPFLF